MAKKCPTSVVATVFIVGSWIMNFYYWHLTDEIWHLAAFTSLICCVLPFTLPGCCCNGFLVMKSVRAGQGRAGKGREGKDSCWYIQVPDKGKDKFEKGLQNMTIQSQKLCTFTLNHFHENVHLSLRSETPSFWHENEPLSNRYYLNSKALCCAAEEATLYTFLHGSSRCKR